MGDLCPATQGKRYQAFLTHMVTYSGAQAFSQSGEEVAWEVNLIRKWNKGSKGVSFVYRSVHFVLSLERIMAFRWRDYVKAEGRDWTDNFNLTKNENPIQHGDEEQIIPCALVFCQVWGFQTLPSHFMPLCFWCALCWDGCLCACDGRIFLITHLFQNQDKYMETSCHSNNVHAAYTAEFDSETGSLYSWGLKLINPHRKKSWCAMRCLLQNKTWHPNSKEQLWQVLIEKSEDYSK